MWHTPSQQTSCPQQKFYMVILLKEQFFQDHQKESIYIRSGRDSFNFKKNRKKTLTKPTEPKICMHSQSQGTSPVLSQTNKAQAPLSGQLVQWLKYWNVDNPTLVQGPRWAESTEETDLIWSPYVMTAPPFKTIWWQKGRNSPKTIPFKTISPARAKSVSFQKETSYMDTRSILFDEPDTHQTAPNITPIIHPWGTTHLDHHHAQPQHHSHSENHLWSPVQRTQSPEGRKRHQSEPAFIWPHDIDQGLSHGLSAPVSWNVTISTLQNTAAGQGQGPREN